MVMEKTESYRKFATSVNETGDQPFAGVAQTSEESEPEFVILLRGPGIDSQPGGIDSWALELLKIRTLKSLRLKKIKMKNKQLETG
jgi:hypothetical protein